MRVPGTAIVGVIAAVAVALPAFALQGGGEINVGHSGLGAERIKTVPIAKKSGGKTKVAMSLSPEKVGPVNPGDAIWAGAEIEISVTCLERIPQCVGSLYRYSPQVKAKLVLGPGPDAKSKKNTVPISGIVRKKCSQDLPNRNHHCVLTVEGTRRIAQGDLRCQRCNVNLIVDAYHPAARKGNVLVVGVDDDHGIEQNKGMIQSVVFNPGPPPDVNPSVARRSATGKVPVGSVGGGGPKKVIYSQRVGDLREGEVLIISAKAVQKIGHLPYNVLMQSQMILSEKRGSVKHSGVPGKAASMEGVITAQNGFNCTQGHSGHSDPCVIRKVGVVRMIRDARRRVLAGEGPLVPLFVNLVVQNREILAGRSSRHRPGDFLRIGRKAGFVEVRRYGP
jgi:hypothetical protein